jgi:hypothetical protein
MKRLMTVLTMVLAFSSAETSWAADCKYQWDTNNYRTGEKVLWTRWVMNKRMITTGVHGLLAGVLEGDQRYLALQTFSVVEHSDQRPTKADIDSAMVIPDNAKLSILMADGTTFDLFAEHGVTGDTSIIVNGSEPDDHFVMGRRSGYTYSSNATVKFALDDDMIATLKAQRATDMRLHSPGKNYDITFGSKPSDKIQDVIACIPPTT